MIGKCQKLTKAKIEKIKCSLLTAWQKKFSRLVACQQKIDPIRCDMPLNFLEKMGRDFTV